MTDKAALLETRVTQNYRTELIRVRDFVDSEVPNKQVHERQNQESGEKESIQHFRITYRTAHFASVSIPPKAAFGDKSHVSVV